MIVTFYSFKGGVGRSMALANVADLMVQQGRRVLAIDFDLEAPGLDRFFDGNAVTPRQMRERRGMIDLLYSYLELRSLTLAGAPRTEPDPTQASFPYSVEPLAEFALPLRTSTDGTPNLLLIPAGRRAGTAYRDYADRVRTFDWDAFYSRWDGEAFFDWFRTETEKLADVVLIDSRTGVTEMSGVCTFQLADVVVMLIAPNQQNLEGCRLMAESLSNPNLIREGRGGRDLSVIPVPARIDHSESAALSEFAADFEQLLAPFMPPGLTFEGPVFAELKIPYIPRYAYSEKVAVREPEVAVAADLIGAYRNLSNAILTAGRSSQTPPSTGAKTAALKVKAGLRGLRSVDARLADLLRPAFEDVPKRAVSPSLLLRAKYGVVPFHGRTAELEDLERWCDDPAAPALKLIVGAGGSGKTRLAAEFCGRRAAKGWLTGFLADGAPDDAVDRVRELHEPALLVLDYAETRANLADILMPLATVDQAQPPLRLLLLARAAGDWWQSQLPNRLPEPELVLAGLGVTILGPATLTTEDRAAAYRAAATAFRVAQHMSPVDVVVPDLHPPDFDVILQLQIAALDAVGMYGDTSSERVGSDGLQPLAAILQREARYWRRSADARGLNHQDRVLRRVVAVATLFGAEDEGGAAAVLARVPDLAGASTEQRRDLARWHRDLYVDQHWLAPLKPELLAEELVIQVLTDSAELRRNGFRKLTTAQAERALTLLDRAASRRPRDMLPMLREILASDTGSLASSAITVAMQTGDPIGRLLAEVLDQAPTSLDSLDDLAGSIPHQTIALREVALVLAAHRVQLARSATADADLALWLNDLSSRLADLGRLEEALAAVQEATALYHRLAASKPDVFLPGLAMSLNNLSVHLANLGRREGALAAIEQAVVIRRKLAESRPDAFLPDLAMSLNNLSVHLADLGRREEALAAIEQAVAHYRELAESRPDAFLPDLATSLNNLSSPLADLGRREEALAAIEQAVVIRRELAESRPDAFLPDLATSLNNLSSRLADLGRREEALAAIEQAVVIRRELAESRPDAFLPDLAGILNNLSSRLADLGRREEALAAIEQAVVHYRELAESRPDAFLPDLAMSLNNLSSHLADLGRPEEALAAIEQAVVHYRELAESRPGAFLPDLAGSLNNLSIRLADLGRREEALAAIEQAVARYRELAESRPDAFLPDLATSLNNLSNRLSDLGRQDEASQARDQAAGTRRGLVTPDS